MDERRPAPAVRTLAGSPGAAVLLTCEHGAERLPPPWRWPAADAWLRGTHWSYDLGAAELCWELGRALGSTAVLADFTRLLIDPNRPPGDATLIRREADGRPVALNEQVEPADERRRLEGYWRVYHETVDQAVAASAAPVLLAIHTFTPLYEGTARPFDVGVLFDRDEEAGERLAADIERLGVSVRLNEPYSGRGGYIYSVDRHALAHRRQALEIEVRQDRATDHAFRAGLVDLLARRRWC